MKVEEQKQYAKDYDKNYYKNYYLKNKERISIRAKEYYKKNKEQYKKRNKEWRLKNKKEPIQILCPNCSLSFWKNSPLQKYCSSRCREHQKRMRLPSYYKTKNHRKYLKNKNNPIWIKKQKERSIIYRQSEKGKVTRKLYEEKNKGRKKIWMNNWLENNKEKIQKDRKIYFQDNKREIIKKNLIYRQKRMQNDLPFKIRLNLRKRVQDIFKTFLKTKKIKKAKDYGIDYTAIIKHLIKNLPKDYSPNKYCIDHIEALCTFDLTNPNEIKKAFAPENHQWLTKEENGHKISEDIQLKKLRKNERIN
jgi:hypothetical protein